MSNTTLWWLLFGLFVIMAVVFGVIWIYYAYRKDSAGNKLPVPAWTWILFIASLVITLILLFIIIWQSNSAKKEDQTVKVV